MVIEFSVSNYGSFNEIQTLSFRSTGMSTGDESVDNANIIQSEDDKLLKIVAIYGANASGKSNFLKALAFFKNMVALSVAREELSMKGFKPFKQIEANVKKPSYFQIILKINSKRYRYGFTINRNGQIESEWLFGPGQNYEIYYFKRTQENIDINNEWFEEGASLPEDNLRTDALFLTFCANYNGPISKEIKTFFQNKVTSDVKPTTRIGSIHVNNGNYNNTNRLINVGSKDVVLEWLKEVGLLYNDIAIEKIGTSFTHEIVILYKNVFDDSGNVTGNAIMDLNEDESEGTKKFYSLIGKLYRKFEQGGLYISDEIDSNFHPSLLQKLIKLFQNPLINKANAQLLFTSHDTNLMDHEIMRKDQFYFTEKDIYDSTKLYSLSDLKGINTNTDFARQYLAGFYGALPILGNFLENKVIDQNKN